MIKVSKRLFNKENKSYNIIYFIKAAKKLLKVLSNSTLNNGNYFLHLLFSNKLGI